MRYSAKIILLLLMTLTHSYHVYAIPTHPMDALTSNEIRQTVTLLKDNKLADSDTQYPYIGLLEMPKSILKSWKSGDPIIRMAKVVLYKNNETYEVELNLTNKKILNQKLMKNVEPSVMALEWNLARNLTLQNPEFLVALKKRNITDIKDIYCSPSPAGYFAKQNYGNKRIFKVPCYQRSNSKNNLYGRPIEGLFSVVDVEGKKVIEIVDTGVIPNPAPVFDYESGNNDRAQLNPVFSISPDGNNYTIKDGILVDWQNWQFHMRMDKRVGAIISMVKYNDRDNDSDGGIMRDIAYQMSVAEMFVPYQDPSENWYYRTFLDNGEFGLGLLTSSLTPGADCPINATFLTINLPNDRGEPFQTQRAVCIFEQNTNAPLWRHGVSGKYSNQTRPMVNLVVRTIPVLGNYDYIIDFIFKQNGEITLRVGASGVLAAKGVRSQSMDDPMAERETMFGTLVAPGIVGPFHSHHFSFRLDLDIDGVDNNLISDDIITTDLGEGSIRKSIWTRKITEIITEGAIDVKPYQRKWRIINKNVKTKLKHNPSYQLVLGPQGTNLNLKDDAQRRALFSNSPLWITRYKENENYSAGDYPNQSKGGEGLPQFIKDRQTVDNKDIILWPTLGFDHIPRTEDWPIMPSMYLNLTIRPFNFFNQNPAIDVPPYFKGFEPPPLPTPLKDKEKVNNNG